MTAAKIPPPGDWKQTVLDSYDFINYAEVRSKVTAEDVASFYEAHDLLDRLLRMGGSGVQMIAECGLLALAIVAGALAPDHAPGAEVTAKYPGAEMTLRYSVKKAG